MHRSVSDASVRDSQIYTHAHHTSHYTQAATHNVHHMYLLEEYHKRCLSTGFTGSLSHTHSHTYTHAPHAFTGASLQVCARNVLARDDAKFGFQVGYNVKRYLLSRIRCHLSVRCRYLTFLKRTFPNYWDTTSCWFGAPHRYEEASSLTSMPNIRHLLDS